MPVIVHFRPQTDVGLQSVSCLSIVQQCISEFLNGATWAHNIILVTCFVFLDYGKVTTTACVVFYLSLLRNINVASCLASDSIELRSQTSIEVLLLLLYYCLAN